MIDSNVLLNLVIVKNSESILFLKDLEAIFVKQTPSLFRRTYEGTEQEKIDMVRQAIHTLKTSCRYLGMMEMYEVCLEIELEAAKDSLDFVAIKLLLKNLESVYFDEVDELKQVITKFGDQASDKLVLN